MENPDEERQTGGCLVALVWNIKRLHVLRAT